MSADKKSDSQQLDRQQAPVAANQPQENLVRLYALALLQKKKNLCKLNLCF